MQRLKAAFQQTCNRAATNPSSSIRTTSQFSQQSVRLSDDGGGGRGLVAPGGRENTDGLVVAGKTVDTRLDQNEAELGVLVLAVALQVLADSDGLVATVRTHLSSIHRKG